MGLTQSELERRRNFITATDVPAILGVSPWANAADVYLAKTQGLASISNDAMEAGTLLEPSVIAWAETRLGPIHPGDWRVHEGGILGCSLDGTVATGNPVEAKTSGITGPGSPLQWGDDGTDEIPDYYLLQVQTQLLVTGQDLAYVPTLLGGRGFVMFVVRANRELQETILGVAEQFWQSNVLEREPPENTQPHFETLKRMMRVPGKSVVVADDLIAEYQRKSQAAKVANKEADEAKAALIAAIGDGEVAKWSGGEFTFYEQTRKCYVCADSTFRVLREKKPRGDKCQTAK